MSKWDKPWPENDLRYTDTGYFNLGGWFKLLDHDPLTQSGIFIFTATRNMGKSQSAWTWNYNEYWKKKEHKWKSAFIRTNDIKMKESIATFKSAYNGEYEVIGGIIYKTQFDENGKPLANTRQEVGRFINVENEHNFRSGVNKPLNGNNDNDSLGGFNGYHFVFWDEFNETKQGKVDLYQKFLMLLSTIKRKNKPFTLVMIGNKIDANNDIFVKLDLNTNDHDLNKDYIQRVGKHITYVDIGYETYKHVTDQDDLVNELASYDYNTNNMFNRGGFLYGQAYNVRNARVFNENHLETKAYFVYNSDIIEFGTWNNNDNEHYYMLQKPNLDSLPEGAEIIALNSVGYALDKRISKYDDESDIIELLDNLYTKVRKQELFFDSFLLKANIEELLFRKSGVFYE